MKKFLADQSGATAIEYGLLAMLIGVALIPVLNSTFAALKATFVKVQTGLAK